MRAALSLLICLSFFSSVLFAADFPEIKGWKKDSEVKKFDAGNLYDYINGAATQFLAFGFQELQYCDLAAGEMIVTVHIYNMGTLLNAFGMYRTEQPRKFTPLAIGGQGYVSPPYQCVLFKDSYYIKVDAYEGDISAEKGQEILQAIADGLPGNNGLPEALDYLPQKNIVPGSESYIRESYLGMKELEKCVFAAYQEKKKTYQIFIMLPKGDETQDDVWIKIKKIWKTTQAKDNEILFRKTPYKGYLGLIKTSKGLLGVSHANNEKTMKKQLVRFLKE